MQLITGMHRSGTSLVANLLFQAGANMGNQETFYRADCWNTKGYYEQPDIHAVNMPLIHGPWGRLTYFALPTEATVLRRAARRSAQIARTAAKYQSSVIKDARFCLTIPAWQAHGGSIEQVLVCLRHPMAVAQSIKRRNRVPLRLGLRLWKEHNERLLTQTDLELQFISYENLSRPESFDRELRAAFRFLNLSMDESRIAELRSNTFDASMNHARMDAGRSMPKSIATLWDRLREIHRSRLQTHLGADCRAA